MKQAIIVTSSIEVRNEFPLTYSQTRSYFSAEERFRQTVYTIACLDRAVDLDTTIYLLDTSEHSDLIRPLLSFQKNLRYISICDQFPEIYEEVTTHPHKTRCECLILAAFMNRYRDELAQYDFTFKLSGRYFFDSSVDLRSIPGDAHNSIMFKKPQQFEWNDSWGLDFLDLRDQQGDNTLRQYSTVLFGWGKNHRNAFETLFETIANTVIEPNKTNSDMETLIYYFTRPLKDSIIETNWTVYGWTGTDGHFMRY
jgi:hypothetical protein